MTKFHTFDKTKLCVVIVTQQFEKLPLRKSTPMSRTRENNWWDIQIENWPQTFSFSLSIFLRESLVSIPIPVPCVSLYLTIWKRKWLQFDTPYQIMYEIRK